MNPLGFYDASPRFSWKLPVGSSRQTAYRIQVTHGTQVVWDSDWVESEQSTFIPYSGERLKSRQRVGWRVNYRDQTGAEGGWSEPATIEMGLLDKNDWQAKWIRPAQPSDRSSEPVGWLKRAFTTPQKVQRARLYVTARGLFEIQLNEQRVGKDYFANGWTTYSKRLDTLTYDVTSQLQQGDNQLLVSLGTGWYAGRFPFAAKKRGPYGEDAQLLLQLELTYEDGTQQIIASDADWLGTFTGPVITSSLYDGESYDARQKHTDWKLVHVQDDLGNAKLTPKPFPAVRQTQVLPTQVVTTIAPGKHVFDLGQNMVGWARIAIPMRNGQQVTLRFAEMLNPDGTLYNANYRTAKSTDTYTAAESGIQHWQPAFTFHGFRYVEVSGVAPDEVPNESWISGVVLRSNLPKIGEFASSHEKLNQLQSNIVWGWRGNSLDIPTDCPQRDERMGWTGDAQAFCPTAMFNTDAHAFWSSWLTSMRGDQESDGSIPDVIPGLVHWRNSPGWIDAATFIPWEVYVRTGDQKVLEDNYEMMQKLVAWYRSKSQQSLIHEIDGYGDWLQPYPKRRGRNAQKGDTPQSLLATAFYARSSQLLASSAQALGRLQEAKQYQAEAKQVRAAFVEHYFTPEARLQNAPETQTAYVLAIAFDLLPAEQRNQAGAHLARLVREHGDCLRTGFLGTPHLAPALDQTGHADLAARLLFQSEYPSWFYSIDQGATTMWERWNSYSHADGFGDVKMNSFNHYAYGAIGQWLYERVAGLTPDPQRPGYKHFFVRPLPMQQLEWARAELQTPYGLAASGWRRDAGEVVIDVTVPPNTTATIQLPGRGETPTVSAGSHQFTLSMD